MTRPVSRFLLFPALLTSCGLAAAQAPGAAVPPAALPAAPPAAPLPPPTPPLPELVSPPGVPTLGRLRIFEDWAIGCDNRLDCSAVSLLPEGVDGNYPVLVRIERGGGPAGAIKLELSGANDMDGKIDLVIDNEAAGRVVAAQDMALITGADAFKLIRRMGSSYAFEIRQGKNSLAAPSLNGLAQALRYMDEQQGRVGSEAAFAAIGERPADLARPVPDAMTFPLGPIALPRDESLALSDAEAAAARTLAHCGGRPRDDTPLEVHALDGDRMLVLVACDAGTDNVSNIVLIGSGEPGARQFHAARFDLVPGFSGDPDTPLLIVNPQWNPVKGTLTSFARGRALGDCGTAEIYRWDGTMFRLTQASAMPVCRGAWEWPVLWVASPAEPSSAAGGGPGAAAH